MTSISTITVMEIAVWLITHLFLQLIMLENNGH
jgi:hypothetical protein